MAKKRKTPQEHSIDPAAQAMLIRADELGIGTAFHRSDHAGRLFSGPGPAQFPGPAPWHVDLWFVGRIFIDPYTGKGTLL